jgi:hypothetical protein
LKLSFNLINKHRLSVGGYEVEINSTSSSISSDEIIKYTYLEAIPWYLILIGAMEKKEIRPSAYHFTALHNIHQDVDARAKYIVEYPLETLSYLLLVSSVSNLLHGLEGRIYDSVVRCLGYSPAEECWINAEEFIKGEITSRLSPSDIEQISLKRVKG